MSSQHRHRQESGNGMVEVPPERVATSRKGRQKDLYGKKGELVKIFITCMPRSGESLWIKVESVAEGSTCAWSEWQKTVTIARLPSSTSLVTRIAMWTTSLLVAFLLELVMKSTLAWPHSTMEISQAKSPSNSTWKCIVPR